MAQSRALMVKSQSPKALVTNKKAAPKIGAVIFTSSSMATKARARLGVDADSFTAMGESQAPTSRPAKGRMGARVPRPVGSRPV